MIDQEFVDTVVPLVRQRLRDLGANPVDVPVTLMTANEDFGGVTFYCPKPEDQPPEGAPAHHVLISDNPAPLSFRCDAEHFENAPFLRDYDQPVWAAATITHELIHTALPYSDFSALLYGGHTADFAKLHRSVGMIGRADMSVPGPEFKQWFDEVVAPVLNKGEIK